MKRRYIDTPDHIEKQAIEVRDFLKPAGWRIHIHCIEAFEDDDDAEQQGECTIDLPYRTAHITVIPKATMETIIHEFCHLNMVHVTHAMERILRLIPADLQSIAYSLFDDALEQDVTLLSRALLESVAWQTIEKEEAPNSE